MSLKISAPGLAVVSALDVLAGALDVMAADDSLARGLADDADRIGTSFLAPGGALAPGSWIFLPY